MRVCMIEDEVLHRDHLIKLLQQWKTQNNVSLEIDCFTSGDVLLSKKQLDYHIIFLDIQLENTTGIEIARILRKRNFKKDLIFLTAYREYVFEGYNVHALNYILKPISYKKLDDCMQYVYQKIRDSYYIYKYRNEIIRISYNDILYFSSSNQYTEIITLDQTYRQAETLKNILQHLPAQFIQCHRTLIVNMHQADKIQGREIIIKSRESLPVSNTYYDNVKKMFLQHLNLNGGF